jgi:hypothetical protein
LHGLRDGPRIRDGSIAAKLCILFAAGDTLEHQGRVYSKRTTHRSAQASDLPARASTWLQDSVLLDKIGDVKHRPFRPVSSVYC